MTNFLVRCHLASIPLDFFSWHCYTDDPAELIARARAIRRLLDHYGFINTESHLNEWNYLPGNSWNGASRKAAPVEREKYFRAMSGDPGAAFILAALIELQDAPVDMCNLYHGELGAFGLFNEFGVAQPSYHALEAFSRVARRPRASIRGNVPGQLAAAASDSVILISNFKHPARDILIRATGRDLATCRVQINSRDAVEDKFTGGELRLQLPSPAIAVIALTP